MKLRRGQLRDLVAVQTAGAETAYGIELAAPVTTEAHISYGRKLVRNRDGDEVVSEARIVVHPDVEDLFTPESVVSFDGREATALNVVPYSMRGKVVRVEVVT